MARRYSPRIQPPMTPEIEVPKGIPDQEVVMSFDRLLKQEEIIQHSLAHYPDRAQRAFRRILKGCGYLHRADTFRRYLEIQFPLQAMEIVSFKPCNRDDYSLLHGEIDMDTCAGCILCNSQLN